MSGETLIILLPILALVLAALSIGGLWYWWTSTRDEKPGERDPAHDLSNLSSFMESDGVGTIPTPGVSAGRPTPPVMPVPPNERLAAASAQLSRPISDGETVEVMRVLRDLADGALIVEIGGRRYRSLREIDDPKTGRRFMGNAQALARFAQLDKYSIPDTWTTPEDLLPSPAEPPLPPAVQAESLPAGEWRAPVPVSGTPDTFRDEGEDESLPRLSFFRRGKEDKTKVTPPPPSMAEQIEALLQQRLAHDATMAHRSIHIHSTPEGGVRVEVDGHYYEGVGDVEDDAVRSFIRATIHQWESQQ